MRVVTVGGPGYRRGVVAGLACIGLLVLTACSSSGSGGPGGGSGGTGSGASSGSPTGSGAAGSIKGQSFSLVLDSAIDPSKVIELHAVELLQQEGVNTSVKFDQASPQVAVARLQRGDIDAYSEAVTGGLDAIIQNVKLVVFALAQPRQDYVLIAKPSIKTLAELKGHTVGVSSITGVNSAQAYLAAQKGGLNPKDLKLQVIGGQSIRAAALLAGRVDATMLSHSFAAKAEKQGFHILFDYTKQAPELYDDVVFTTPKWLSTHQQLAIAYNKAILDSFKWFNNPANASDVVSEALKSDPTADKSDVTQLFQLLRAANAYPNGAILDASKLNQQQQLYQSVGAITKTVPVSQWVNTTYAEKAKAED